MLYAATFLIKQISDAAPNPIDSDTEQKYSRCDTVQNLKVAYESFA